MVQIYPSVELKARMTTHLADTRQSLAQVTLDAIQAVHSELSGAWAPARKSPTQLFVRSAYANPQSHDTRQTGIRLNADDIEVIDDLASQAGAPSRSAYIVAAWERFLSNP